jgi:hypothetical protein
MFITETMSNGEIKETEVFDVEEFGQKIIDGVFAYRIDYLYSLSKAVQETKLKTCETSAA